MRAAAAADASPFPAERRDKTPSNISQPRCDAAPAPRAVPGAALAPRPPLAAPAGAEQIPAPPGPGCSPAPEQVLGGVRGLRGEPRILTGCRARSAPSRSDSAGAAGAAGNFRVTKGAARRPRLLRPAAAAVPGGSARSGSPPAGSGARARPPTLTSHPAAAGQPLLQRPRPSLSQSPSQSVCPSVRASGRSAGRSGAGGAARPRGAGAAPSCRRGGAGRGGADPGSAPPGAGGAAREPRGLGGEPVSRGTDRTRPDRSEPNGTGADRSERAPVPARLPRAPLRALKEPPPAPRRAAFLCPFHRARPMESLTGQRRAGPTRELQGSNGLGGLGRVTHANVYG